MIKKFRKTIFILILIILPILTIALPFIDFEVVNIILDIGLNIVLPCLFLISFCVFMPLSIHKPSRKYGFALLCITLLIYGILLWLLSAHIVNSMWGTGIYFMGALLAGVGIIPMALIAVISSGMWNVLIILIALYIAISIAYYFIEIIYRDIDKEILDKIYLSRIKFHSRPNKYDAFAIKLGLKDFFSLLYHMVGSIDEYRFSTILSMNSLDEQALSFANFFGFRTVNDMFAYFEQTGNYNINVFFERYNLLQQKRMSKSIESGQQPVPRNESKTDTPT